MSQSIQSVPRNSVSGLTSSVQDTAAPQSVDHVHNILLNRLSGLGEQEHVFDGGQVPHGNPFAGLADDLARKPLIGPAAEQATDAQKLVENLRGKPIRDEDIRQFETLRANALETGSPEAKTYFDALARVLLLRPLTEAAEGFGPGAKAGLVLALHGQMEHILAADTDLALLQAQNELQGSRELLRQEGRLGPEQEDALNRLDNLLAYRSAHLATLDGLENKTSQMEAGETDLPPLQQLYSNALTLKDKTELLSHAACPPLGLMVIENLAYPAAKLAGRLERLSRKTADAIKGQADDLLGRIRKPDADPKALAPSTKAVGDKLETSSDRLLQSDKLLLDAAYAKLEGALEVGHCVVEGEKALRETPNSARALETCRDGLAERGKGLSLYDEDAARLQTVQKKLDMRIADLRSTAEGLERTFRDAVEKRIEEARSPAAFDAIRKDIADRLERLETTPEESSNLRESLRQRFTDDLKELTQRCHVEQFRRLITGTESTRSDAPSLEECWGRIADSGLDEASRKNVEALFAASSQKALAELRQTMLDLRGKLGGSTDELRKLPLSDLAELAERRLLPAERETFSASLQELKKDVGEALFRAAAGIGASPESGLASGLTETQAGTLKELCIRAWCHPSLMAALASSAAKGDLAALLDAVRNGTANPGAANSDAATRLDALLLPYPELDDTALAVKRDCTREDQRELLAYRHESARANREIGRVLNELIPETVRSQLGLDGTEVNTALLERLVNAAGNKGKAFSQMDLLLVRALWCARQAEGNTDFKAFQQSLPETFRDIPGLENLMGAGVGSAAMLRGLSKSIAKMSRSFGGRNSLLQLCERIATSDEKWAASVVLTKLTRNLLGGLSFSGTQAMQGNASALRKAFERELAAASGPGSLADATRVLFGRADQTARTAYPEQLSAFASRSEELTAAAQRLELLAADYEAAKGAFTGDEQRSMMLERLEGVLDGDTLANLREGEKADIHGATLAMGLLLLKTILTEEGFGDFAARRALLNSLKFQSHIDFNAMRGSNLVWGRDSGDKDFRRALASLKAAKTEAEFTKSTGDMLRLFTDQSLDQKAEAILFFKRFSGFKATQNVTLKLDAALDTPKPLQAELDALQKSMQTHLVGLIGVASKQDTSVAAAGELKHETMKEIEEMLTGARRAFSTQVLDTLEKATQAAVCNRFLAHADVSSAEDLIRDRTTPIANWPFYTECLQDMERLGIARTLAEPFLMKALHDLKKDSFIAFAETARTDASLAFRALAIRAQTPGEMRKVVNYGEFLGVSQKFMDALREPGTTLTLNTGGQFSVAIPIVETGAADVKAHISAALRSGLSVWKDGEGYHMTLMRSKSGGVGASVEGILETIEVSLDANISAGNGCDLLFTNETNCREFLATVLAGQGSGALLPLCSQVRHASSYGLGASITVKAGWGAALPGSDEDAEDWLSVGIGMGMEGALGWETSRNSDHVTLTKTVSRSLEITASASFLPETATAHARDIADMALAQGPSTPGRLLDAALAHSEIEKTLLSLSFEERRELSTSANGTLEGAERTRVFHLDTAAEARSVLVKHGVPEAMIRDVEADIEQYGDGGFRLEVAHTLGRAAVDRYNAQKDHLPSASSYDLSELRLIVDEASVMQRRGITLGDFTAAHVQSGNRERTLQYRAALASVN